MSRDADNAGKADPVDSRAIPNLTGCCVGDIDDPGGLIYDARTTTRAEAIREFAAEYDLKRAEVKCSTWYARWLSRDEQWELSGRDNWEPDEWDEDGPEPEAPDEAPEGWEPDEYGPVWERCRDRTDPRAVKVYVCEER